MDFKMQIAFDDEMNEYYLKFLDIDDRAKKSRALKAMYKANVSIVTMTLEADETEPTKGQKGMFDAFLILLEDYTGSTRGEVRESIFSELEIGKEDIAKFNRKEYSAFIERLFYYCSHNVGIEVELVNNKLTIMKNE